MGTSSTRSNRKKGFSEPGPQTRLTARQFEKRIAELIAARNRLEQRLADGWGYRRVHIKKTRVKAHTRHAHWALVAYKNR
jgi:hypothetical protein